MTSEGSCVCRSVCRLMYVIKSIQTTTCHRALRSGLCIMAAMTKCVIRPPVSPNKSSLLAQMDKRCLQFETQTQRLKCSQLLSGSRTASLLFVSLETDFIFLYRPHVKSLSPLAAMNYIRKVLDFPLLLFIITDHYIEKYKNDVFEKTHKMNSLNRKVTLKWPLM